MLITWHIFPVSLIFPNSDRTPLCFHGPTHPTETTLGVLFEVKPALDNAEKIPFFLNPSKTPLVVLAPYGSIHIEFPFLAHFKRFTQVIFQANIMEIDFFLKNVGVTNICPLIISLHNLPKDTLHKKLNLGHKSHKTQSVKDSTVKRERQINTIKHRNINSTVLDAED